MTNNKIHSTAIIDESAKLGNGVSVGPYTVIGKDVVIGDDTTIAPHVVIGDRATIGSKCRIFQFASVGAPPQDMAYNGEETSTVIGDKNTIREFVTIHAGTVKDKAQTTIGDNNLFMNYVHVAHDCIVGSNIVMANNATLAGHVHIDDHAIVGGLVAVHQFVHIGAYCIIGGASAVSKDIPPYVMAVGNRATLHGLNRIGLKRKGFSKEALNDIKEAYNILFHSSLTIKEATERLKTDFADSLEVGRFIDFIANSTRGMAREKTHNLQKSNATND
ncbi:MAG: acyl-ACP--UDP-N-acetylglucosamine O-acyltransferase [Deltaproteobacteria bacterium]|nr:acyl-ACP--UDP-N-acetylglucosamine O-acyltransferase [Deltaproteobacteria bacterium]